ncbi:exonuclease [Vibrio phage 166E36-1]
MNKFSFKPSSQVEEDSTSHVSKRFKMVWVDADTILHSSAIALQQSYINVKHIPSGRVKRFDNKTAFGVRGVKIIPNKWLDTTNQNMIEKGKEPFKLEDFEIEECYEIKPEFTTHTEAIEYGLQSIGFAVGGLKKYADSEDYRLIISGGKGNYRNDLAKTLKYKGKRTDKPILYSELKEAMLEQYKTKVVLADFCEAEDLCGWYASQQEIKFGEDFDKWEECISFIDKDVKMVYSPSINYRNFEDGFTFPTKLECAAHLVSQIVAGDESCDNIRGLPNLTEEVTKKFGLRKANGCGKTPAENLIADCTTEKEMYERAVFAYQSYFGMEPIEFKAWDGEVLTWTWLDFMRETAVLVKMQDFEHQVWDVEDKLQEWGIAYENKLFPEPVRTFCGNEAHIVEVEALIKDILDNNVKGLKSKKKVDQAPMIDQIREKLESIDFECHYEMVQKEK